MKGSHYSLFSRLLFLLSAVLFFFAAWKSILLWFGYSLPWIPYSPSRLIEIAAIMMIFVIAILLRQIRDGLRNK